MICDGLAASHMVAIMLCFSDAAVAATLDALAEAPAAVAISDSISRPETSSIHET